MDTESASRSYRPDRVEVVAGLMSFIPLVAYLACSPLSAYHRLLVRAVELQACASLGERLIFAPPLF